MENAVHAMDTVILMDGYALHDMLTSARLPLSKQDVDTSTFGRRDMTAIVGMRNGALNIEGFRDADRAAYQRMLNDIIGGNDAHHHLSYAPEGDDVGNQVFILDSHENSFEVGAPYQQAVMLTAVFNATGGPRLGRILHKATGPQASFLDIGEIQRFSVDRMAPGNITLESAGLADAVFAANANAAAIIAAIEGMDAAYVGNVDATTNVALQGGKAEVIRLKSNQSHVNGDFTAPATDLGAGGGLVIMRGDSNAVVEANLKLLAGYNDAGVTVSGPGTTAVGGDQTHPTRALASSSTAGREPANAFDDSIVMPGDSWSALGGSVLPQWVGNDLGAAKTITNYDVYFDNAAGQQPTDWTLEGADDAAFTVGLVTLDTVAAHAIPGASGYVNFVCDAPASKRYVRLNITGINSGTVPVVRELRFNAAGQEYSSGYYDITFAGALNYDQIADWVVNSADWEYVVLQQGEAQTYVGDIDVLWDASLGSVPQLTTPTPEVTPSLITGGGRVEYINPIAASGTGAVVDGGAASANGYTGHLHLIAATADATLTVTVEGSADGLAGWATVFAFDVQAGVGSQRKVHKTAAVPRYLRITWVLAGTAPQVAFGVSVSREGNIISR
jgi:hypothetical protein